MSNFLLSDKDVLLFEGYKPFDLSRTVRFDDFHKKVKETLCYHDREAVILLKSGIDCEMLYPGGTEWKKGKLKIKFEFVPESDSENSELDEFRDSETQS